MFTSASPTASALSILVDTLVPIYAAKRSLSDGIVAMAAMVAPRLMVPAMTGRRETADIVGGFGEKEGERLSSHLYMV